MPWPSAAPPCKFFTPHLPLIFALLFPPAIAIAAPRATGGSLKQALAVQIALERVGYSPGVIDGTLGRKTKIALAEFQRVHHLPETGSPDAATNEALRVDPSDSVTDYRVTTSDVTAVGPSPEKWLEKSKLKYLGYDSVEAAIAEKFHCSRGLLRCLNPGRNLTKLSDGESIVVPNISCEPAHAAQHLEIDLGEKIIRVYDSQRRLAAIFHCSIAKKKEKLPSGETKIDVVSENPTYLFDPKMWPEVKDVKQKILIPHGPRNPVGLCWMGLKLPGYGIHGSPNPELIGKTGSHGCFRLTNWDALRLAKMVHVGTKVSFINDSQVAMTDPRS
ncbi:MAG: murein L,D-transpeptidase [Planctomycetes bacterium]|nr:murein L,D-transpeptidase [Planctomycetota bacterium]MBI3835434.1 murein L,D-transpeptidase [Planctomycetota bacterium]